MLKKITVAAVAAGLALASVSSANAAGGCGPGGHRGPHGHCRPNGPGVVGPGVVVGAPSIGVFYAGRGWWDGHRYYQHRYAYRHGWRYR
jgi:hypothetical protein